MKLEYSAFKVAVYKQQDGFPNCRNVHVEPHQPIELSLHVKICTHEYLNMKLTLLYALFAVTLATPYALNVSGILPI